MMKYMKKSLMAAMMVVSLLSCSGKGTDIPDVPYGKQYRLEVEGKPFLMLGAQLRTDYFLQLDGRSLDNLDDYFSLAAGLNITCIQVPIAWSDVETDYDRYTDAAVRAYIDYCEKYGMKLEILWYGSYMCGYSVEGYLPEYIVRDTDTYPELNPAAAYQGWLGKQFYLKPGNASLVDREAKAITRMMEFVRDYDALTGSHHTVIGVQIENEPDMLATRHNAAHGYAAMDIWPSLIHHLDALGEAVKSVPYECWTRVNQTTAYDDWVLWSRKLVEREGIDYVGFDPYVNDIPTLEDWLNKIGDIPGNFSHIAENGGEYMNNDLLTLKALTMGCGYEVFEVITTPHPFLVDWTLRGVYNPDFSEKAQTRRLIDAYRIFKDSWYDFAMADPENMYGFNLEDSAGKFVTEEAVAFGSVSISWKTASRGVAFAISGDGYLTVASTKADTMSFSGNVRSVESGHYDSDGAWVRDGDASFGGGTLQMSPCKVYRLITE